MSCDDTKWIVLTGLDVQGARVLDGQKGWEGAAKEHQEVEPTMVRTRWSTSQLVRLDVKALLVCCETHSVAHCPPGVSNTPALLSFFDTKTWDRRWFVLDGAYLNMYAL